MSEAAVPVQTVASNAFTFLAEEEAHGDRQTTEALLLTFNTDLGFFEARLLGLLRATGARVTVVGDSGVWQPDTRAVRHAGRSYHFGLCDTRAAFHPKLMVLAGEKRAIVTVGSGNLTMGGWQYNAELLTVFRGDTEGMPTAFADIRDLLTSLAESRSLDHIATRAVRRTVTTLDGLLAGAEAIDTGHRVHASWDGPLIDHLPTGPVEEVSLSAAFHDPASAAMRRILDRLRPRHVKVAVQPGWTHLDPTTLHAVLARYAGATGGTWDLLRDPESARGTHGRYRHGKLIEWTTADGERHALTGSPNLSHRALIADVASGGNHEIAVIGPSAQPLFPGGTPLVVDDIPVLLVDEDAVDGQPLTKAGPGIHVRVAARTRDGAHTEVHLNREPQTAATIEVSAHSDLPDHWSRLGNIAPGHRTRTFPTAVPAGSRIRAATTNPATGLSEATAPVYVADVERIHMRATPTKYAPRTHRAVAADLFGPDIALLDSLQSDLANFAKDLQNANQPTRTREALPEGDGPERSRGGDTAEPWLWLQDDTVRRFGSGLASWLLALPQLHNTDGVGADVPWLDKINEDAEVGLEDEDAAAATEEVLEAEPTVDEPDAPDHRADHDRLKTARRKWVTKAAAIAPEVPLVSRLLILRLTLAFWSAGNWPDDAIEPFTLVRDLLHTLDASEDQPEELRERVSALAAIALTLMRHRTDLATRDQKTLRYHQAAELGAPLLTAVSEDAIDAYTTGLRTGHGGMLTSGHVIDAIADLTSNDPLVALHSLMEERGHTVTRPSPHQIRIHGNFSTPEQVALDAMGIVEEATGVAVWACNPSGDWTLVVWNRPDLVTINKRRAGTARWRHQRLRLMGPAATALALKRGGPSSLPHIVFPQHRPTQAARDVLATVGIAEPEPPENEYDRGDEEPIT